MSIWLTKCTKYVIGSSCSGRLFALRENKSTGEWTRSNLCIGNSDACTGDLVKLDLTQLLLAFGEDEDGELYVLTSPRVQPDERRGVVYQLVDPAR